MGPFRLYVETIDSIPCYENGVSQTDVHIVRRSHSRDGVYHPRGKAVLKPIVLLGHTNHTAREDRLNKFVSYSHTMHPLRNGIINFILGLGVFF